MGLARIAIPAAENDPSRMTFGSWLESFWSTKYSLLPTSVQGSPSSSEYFAAPPPTRKRLLQITCAAFGVILVFGYTLRLSSNDARYTIDPYSSSDELQKDTQAQPDQNATDVVNEIEEVVDMWGWSESMGWEQTQVEGLADLGEVAESRYRLHMSQGEEGTRQYFQQLYDFTLGLNARLQRPLLTSLQSHLPPMIADILPDYSNPIPLGPPAMTSYKNIFQTDKMYNPDAEETRRWTELNRPDGWSLNFYDDSAAQDWVDKTFRRSDVHWAWDYMHRGVLKADFLRYLLPLVEGGVYSDVDTTPIRPIEQWGQVDVEYLDISSTDGQDWRLKLSTQPSVMVAIDVDVHAKEGWENGWPRPLGICQWTLSGAPNHPIFLDAVRRVVNATHVVEEWEQLRADEIERIESEKGEGWEEQVEELKGQGRDHAMNVMEWTGPGLFTDSVMAYILARYNVTWHRLRGLHHPLRIGDVMILPITAFSPGGEPDFRAENPDSPQADVLHNFRGSWKGDGA